MSLCAAFSTDSVGALRFDMTLLITDTASYDTYRSLRAVLRLMAEVVAKVTALRAVNDVVISLLAVLTKSVTVFCMLI